MAERFKLCICGHFAFGENKLNGQTIKTKVVTEALEQMLGTENITKIDTCGGVKSLFRLPFLLTQALRRNDNLVILPAYKGVRVITFILSFLRLFFHDCKVHYVVIGGWLPKYVRTKFLLKRCLSASVDTIYCETSTMMRQLAESGFTNTVLMPNCKDLPAVTLQIPCPAPRYPLRLCTFSRVMKQKGMEDIVRAVDLINAERGSEVFTLDIYGPVWPDEQEWFDGLKKGFSSAVHYAGTVPFDATIDALQDYFLLVFPTLFYTEGVPGTIIDAYAAALPVLASRWESFGDVIDEGKTGIGYEFGSFDALCQSLKDIADRPEQINRLKPLCLEKYRQFRPTEVIAVLVDELK
ncbi:MAG: glycosyltransferase [Bacteroidaceae bacterium]|nr:glycosyltransferase [Bacteroidaceae bacterium]